MNSLMLELRRVDPSERTVVGVCAPYDEVSYLTWNPEGECIQRGAFRRSLQHRRQMIPLLRNHAQDIKLGRSTAFDESAEGLIGTFKINEGDPGDALLDELRQGYLDAMSVGFQSVREAVRDDGVRVIVEARLVEVSMVALPAYQGAAMLAVRNAQTVDDLLAPFANRPVVNLDPIPSIWHTAR